jgi:hypothetical protein
LGEIDRDMQDILVGVLVMFGQISFSIENNITFSSLNIVRCERSSDLAIARPQLLIVDRQMGRIAAVVISEIT